MCISASDHMQWCILLALGNLFVCHFKMLQLVIAGHMTSDQPDASKTVH